ncbi:all development altered-7 [Apiospora saccharicola]|uniref:All development altered-7 n=1 Tax=Apiospora saccharicola TaxID=335842 RepID=A0ABR1U5R6_9PEZI
MPRKGHEKARTGCITCKLTDFVFCRTRKVKCDEAKPDCLRCQKSGRACAGYEAPPLGSYSWVQLLRVRPSTVPSDGRHNSMEMRGLDYFRCVVAPTLSGPMHAFFWTNPVLQLSVQDVSARQAVLAISLLYERFDRAHNPSFDAERQEFAAISCYNKALRQTATSNDLDIGLALFLSILFACIECLRSNHVGVIEHCRHGATLLQSCKDPPPEITPIIRHLSTVPFCFGTTLLDFPILPWHQGPLDEPFKVVSEAGQSVDSLLCRAVCLVRVSDPYNFDFPGVASPTANLVSPLHELRQDLDTCLYGLQRLEGRRGSEGPSRDPNSAEIYRIVEMRWLVCMIWVSMALNRDDDPMIPLEAHAVQFERIVQLGRELAYRESIGEMTRKRVLTFDLGLAPFLHFAALKCPILPLRLEAMDLMEKLACPRETLWDSNVMLAVNRRAIEQEHDIQLPLQLQGNWQQFINLSTTPPVNGLENAGTDLVEDSQWDAQARSISGEELILSPHYCTYKMRGGLDVADVHGFVSLVSNTVVKEPKITAMN